VRSLIKRLSSSRFSSRKRDFQTSKSSSSLSKQEKLSAPTYGTKSYEPYFVSLEIVVDMEENFPPFFFSLTLIVVVGLFVGSI